MRPAGDGAAQSRRASVCQGPKAAAAELPPFRHRARPILPGAGADPQRERSGLDPEREPEGTGLGRRSAADKDGCERGRRPDRRGPKDPAYQAGASSQTSGGATAGGAWLGWRVPASILQLELCSNCKL